MHLRGRNKLVGCATCYSCMKITHVFMSASVQLVSSLVPGSHSDPLPPLIPEEKVVFGLLITCPLLKTIHELTKAYSTVDVSTIAREVSRNPLLCFC